MKKILSILLFTIIALSLNAQNYYNQFQEYQESEDTLKQIQLLEQWEEEDPNDPELYTCYFNYYFNLSRNEMMVLKGGDIPQGEEVLVLTDSSGADVGYLGSEIIYNDNSLQNSFKYINKGIKLFPDRLDMRFGYIYALGQIEDWENFTIEIIKTIDYSATNENKWLWTLNQSFDNAEERFLGSLLDYQVQLYDCYHEKRFDFIKEIALDVLKYYPKNVENLSYLSIVFIYAGDYEAALVPLRKAEKIDPKDYIILNNIAYSYREMGNKKMAKKYYKKVVKYGTPEAVEHAKKEIEALNK